MTFSIFPVRVILALYRWIFWHPTTHAVRWGHCGKSANAVVCRLWGYGSSACQTSSPRWRRVMVSARTTTTKVWSWRAIAATPWTQIPANMAHVCATVAKPFVCCLATVHTAYPDFTISTTSTTLPAAHYRGACHDSIALTTAFWAELLANRVFSATHGDRPSATVSLGCHCPTALILGEEKVAVRACSRAFVSAVTKLRTITNGL
mmetsp:Transcript_43238/g.85644  ORF Transcript_43238/g.85644 Transcript_43238/m.85644 type:complete len:206 (-) Transcript_43238:613-1230(-)